MLHILYICIFGSKCNCHKMLLQRNISTCNLSIITLVDLKKIASLACIYQNVQTKLFFYDSQEHSFTFYSRIYERTLINQFLVGEKIAGCKFTLQPLESQNYTLASFAPYSSYVLAKKWVATQKCSIRWLYRHHY